MAARNALVTGAGGFVGSRVVQRLEAAGWSVATLGQADSPGRYSFRFDGTMASVETAIGTCRPEIVFHIASMVLVDHRPADVAPLIDSNIRFPAMLIEAMSGSRCRHMVNIGSYWQHHKATAGYEPTNLYAATKQAFESLAEYYCTARGMSVTTLKLTDTYGPSDTRKKLLPLMIRSLLDGAELGLSPGEQKIDLVHVDDVAEAILTAGAQLRAGELAGCSDYLIRSGLRMSIRELVAMLEALSGLKLRAIWGARAYREREVMDVWEGPTLPGWRPRIGLEDGLRQMIDHIGREARAAPPAS